VPAVAISCISPGLREILMAEAKQIEDREERKAFLEILEELKECPKGVLLGIEDGWRKRRGTREPSAYNLHMRQCMLPREKGGKGTDFRGCVAQWRQSHAA